MKIPTLEDTLHLKTTFFFIFVSSLNDKYLKKKCIKKRNCKVIGPPEHT